MCVFGQVCRAFGIVQISTTLRLAVLIDLKILNSDLTLYNAIEWLNIDVVAFTDRIVLFNLRVHCNMSKTGMFEGRKIGQLTFNYLQSV